MNQVELIMYLHLLMVFFGFLRNAVAQPSSNSSTQQEVFSYSNQTEILNYTRENFREMHFRGKMCMTNVALKIANAEYLNENLDGLHALHAKLDAYLQSYDINEGHSGQSYMILERQVYRTIAKEYPCVKSICEIGFNAGHSALGWLSANPDAKVTMFDLWEHTYNAKAEEFIRLQTDLHPDRMKIIKGSSLETVKKYHAENPRFRCDVISIDGGHSYDIAVKDVDNMKFLANQFFNILLIDDTNCDKTWCVDSTIQEHCKRGTIDILEGFSLSNNERGISIMTYNRLKSLV